jgi:hypothetical protein
MTFRASNRPDVLFLQITQELAMRLVQTPVPEHTPRLSGQLIFPSLVLQAPRKRLKAPCHIVKRSRIGTPILAIAIIRIRLESGTNVTSPGPLRQL